MKEKETDRLGTFLNILFVCLIFFFILIELPALALISPVNKLSISTSATTGATATSSTTPIRFIMAPSPLASTLRLETVDTEASREQGLSDTTSLPADEGMWFVFQTPDEEGIWMKDMQYPLDIIWLDANMKVQYIVKDALPSSYPSTVYAPAVKSSYVLEVNAGYAVQHGIIVGDVLTSDISLAFLPKM